MLLYQCLHWVELYLSRCEGFKAEEKYPDLLQSFNLKPETRNSKLETKRNNQCPLECNHLAIK